MQERKDAMGNRMKAYEAIETSQKFRPNSLIYARLDGRSFSKFTKGLARPWDERMSTLMQEVTKHLVKEFNCLIGYTQSDEISLLMENKYESPMIFEGKKQKVISSLSAYATAVFVSKIPEFIPEKQGKFPTFDCRIFEVPSDAEAANAFLWREYDASKNSVSMLAGHYFSHKELQGMNGKVKIDMLKTKKDVIWEDCPAYFKFGTYVKRVQKVIVNPAYPDAPAIRHSVETVSAVLQDFENTEDRVKFVMNKEMVLT